MVAGLANKVDYLTSLQSGVKASLTTHVVADGPQTARIDASTIIGGQSANQV